MATVFGRCLTARATHQRPSRNLCCVSALCVGIAIAGGCARGPFHNYKADEIQPSTYRDILWDARNGEAPECAQMIPGFMADDKIDYAELERLNACDAEARNRTVPLADVKHQLVKRMG